MLGLLVLPVMSLVAFVAFDVRYLRQRRARLTQLWEGRYEGWLHGARGVAYTLQFFVISDVWFEGVCHAALAALCGGNTTVIAIAVADLLCERDRRRNGGLPEARTSPMSRLGGRP